MGLAIVVVMGLLAYRHFQSRRPKKRRRSELAQLMAECDGDRELVERLLFAEMEQSPQLDFGEAARRARARLTRDRR